jgi:hypothetical protein
MKRNFNFFLVVALALPLIFTSCKKDDSESGSPGSSGSNKFKVEGSIANLADAPAADAVYALLVQEGVDISNYKVLAQSPISADGKFTLNLPEKLEDADLTGIAAGLGLVSAFPNLAISDPSAKVATVAFVLMKNGALAAADNPQIRPIEGGEIPSSVEGMLAFTSKFGIVVYSDKKVDVSGNSSISVPLNDLMQGLSISVKIDHNFSINSGWNAVLINQSPLSIGTLSIPVTVQNVGFAGLPAWIYGEGGIFDLIDEVL